MPRLVFTASLSLALVVGLASAQEYVEQAPPPPQGSLVCDSVTGACEWKSQGGSNPGSQYVAPSASLSPNQPVRWLFSWAPAPPSALRMRRPPAPQCAISIDEAMGRIQTGLATGNLNLVFSGYDWAGQSDASAEALTNRLSALMAGAWQARVVEGRMGGPDTDTGISQPPERMRLIDSAGHIQAEFSAVERMGCWFLQFTSVSRDEDVTDPSPVTQVTGEGGNIIQILSEPEL